MSLSISTAITDPHPAGAEEAAAPRATRAAAGRRRARARGDARGRRARARGDAPGTAPGRPLGRPWDAPWAGQARAGQSWMGKLIELSTVSFWEGQRVVTAFWRV